MFLFKSLTVLLFVNHESNGSDEDESENNHRNNDDDGHVNGILCRAENNKKINMYK